MILNLTQAIRNLKGKALLPAAIALLCACGPSESQKMEVATITCNIIGETRKADGADRLREVTSARKRLGNEPFLGNDDEILSAYSLGLCEDLISSPQRYEEKLLAIIVQQAKEKREREELEASAREKAEQELALARVAKQKKDYEEALSRYSRQRADLPAIASINYIKGGNGAHLKVVLDCKNKKGPAFETALTLTLKEGDSIASSVQACGSKYLEPLKFFDLDPNQKQRLEKEAASAGALTSVKGSFTKAEMTLKLPISSGGATPEKIEIPIL